LIITKIDLVSDDQLERIKIVARDNFSINRTYFIKNWLYNVRDGDLTDETKEQIDLIYEYILQDHLE